MRAWKFVRGVIKSVALSFERQEAERAGDGMVEVFGVDAVSRIANLLPPVEQAYARIRFSILRPKLLSVMDLLLPEEGRILDIGCGFGLFSAYFSLTHPDRRLLGIDPDGRRIETARRVAAGLGIPAQFAIGDARSLEVGQAFDAAYLLDVMHHIPAEHQRQVLLDIRELLKPGGLLIVKDITTTPSFGAKFTELLDRVMVGWDEPLAYRHHAEWGALLEELGFRVRMVRVPDILPYPHVVIAARKLA